MYAADLDPAALDATERFQRLLTRDDDVAGVIVFGSRTRRTHRADSDADVAVLLRSEHQRFLPTKLALSDIAFDVLLDTGVNILPLPIWMDEWEHPDAYRIRSC